MRSIKKRAIIEFVFSELKVSPTDAEFQKSCENYVRLELRISEKAELNSKLQNFCKHATKLYRKSSKYLE